MCIKLCDYDETNRPIHNCIVLHHEQQHKTSSSRLDLSTVYCQRGRQEVDWCLWLREVEEIPKVSKAQLIWNLLSEDVDQKDENCDGEERLAAMDLKIRRRLRNRPMKKNWM
jgi:hypothetical protein